MLLRRAEENDSLEERAPPRAINAAMFERENQRGYAQNHMISVTQRKPGVIRWFTARLAFWGIGQFASTLLPTRIPEDHRHHPFRALGYCAWQSRSPVLLELRRQLGKLSRRLHHARRTTA